MVQVVVGLPGPVWMVVDSHGLSEITVLVDERRAASDDTSGMVPEFRAGRLRQVCTERQVDSNHGR